MFYYIGGQRSNEDFTALLGVFNDWVNELFKQQSLNEASNSKGAPFEQKHYQSE
jgi:hypothetical protein